MHFHILFLGLIFLFACSEGAEVKSELWNNGQGFKVDNGIMFKDKVPFTGEIVKMYENGKVHSKTNYVNGQMHGVSDSWYADGHLLESRHYTKGYKTGIHKGWWQNSKKKFIYSFNDTGQYEGELLEWTETGQPYKIMNYKNGKEAGHQRIWDEEGNIKSNYTAINGDRYGLVNMKNCYTVDNESNEIKM